MLVARRIMILLELIVGVLALGGGAALVAAPSGRMLGFDVAMLHGTFRDFLWPGLCLIGMGLVQLFAAWATWRRVLWDHVASTAAGAVLILWISVQVVLVGLTHW